MKSIWASLLAPFLRLSAVFILGIPLAILANIALARNVSVADFGVYGFFISLASVLAVPAVGGFPLLLMREVSGYVKDNKAAKYRGLMRTARIWTIAYSIALWVAALGYVLILDKDIELWIFLALAFVPLMSFAAINGGALRGLEKFAIAALPVQVLQPIALIIGFLGIGYAGFLNSTNALVLYGAVLVGVQLILIVLLLGSQPKGFNSGPLDYSDRQIWIRSFIPFVTIGAMNILGTQVATLVLGFIGDTKGVAYLRVAERAAQLAIFPLSVLNTVIAPQIVQHIKDGNRLALRNLARRSARLCSLGSASVGFVLLIFGKDLIGLTFGASYIEDAYTPMITLVVFQILVALNGNAGMILAMSGNERHNLIGQGIGLSVLLVMLVVLIAPFGVLGAAIAVGVGLLVQNLYSAIVVWFKLSIWAGLA